jgi:hypothetical protein
VNAVDELEAAAEVADAVIVPPGDAWAAAARSALDAAPRHHFADPAQRPLLFTVVDVAPGATANEARAWIEPAAEPAADGIVLRPTGADLRETIELAGQLPVGDSPTGRSLRARLGLPKTASLLADGPGVFPVPVPQA